jgi:uncharacterized protein YjeT (DUF2065 family)
MAGRATSWKTLTVEGFAVFGAPAAWVTQLVFGYAATGYACYPQHAWRTTVDPNLDWARPVSLAVNLAALAVCVAGAWTAWRLHRAAASAASEVERRRLRFNGLCGLLSGAIFLAGTLANTTPLLGVPTC